MNNFQNDSSSIKDYYKIIIVIKLIAVITSISTFPLEYAFIEFSIIVIESKSLYCYTVDD